MTMDLFDPPPSYSSLFESTTDLTGVSVPKTVLNPNGSNEANVEILKPAFIVTNTRVTFISQVLNILLLQYLSLTHLLIMVVVLIRGYPSVREVVGYYNMLWIPASAAIYLVILGLLLYSTEARWRAPQKYLFLVAYPFSFVLFLSAITVPDIIEAVLIGGIYFCVIIFIMKVCTCVGCEVRLMDRRPECSRYAVYIVTAVLLIVMYASTVIFLQYNALQLLCVIIVVFLQFGYTMVDIRAMMTIDHRFDIGPKDYAKAALVLYIDYIYIIKMIYRNKNRSTPLIS